MQRTARQSRHRWALGPFLLLGLAACGEDIQPEPGPALPTDGEPAPLFRHTRESDGSVTTIVDATDGAAWRALDLDTSEAAEAAVQSAWDVSFQRFHIRTRGGVNGTGGVGVALLPDTFESITQAPASGYHEDAADSDDTDSEPDNVFERVEDGWYSYDVMTHTLTPRARTYVLRSDAGRYFKLRMLSYYDPAGSPAVLSFRWKQVDPPSPSLTHARGRLP
ncbi:putative lipoprotein [Cystobacter fuscus DSM 2262]|uniref:Lipoprotein n=1 Tax=Cystobacter fuscus (strain ATCC 25194 / DSM 2262 / NBRC 100088 / M29) TaxID=1242864 RepID=S9PEJ1_CYSF2|nr:HmuY family protein [Cystobacter fuscus]EPX62810.1 putative lipoprotein [Cystobacter fuscus DSM 2262]